MLGPTGSGKSTLLVSLLPLQPHVVFFGTKPRDETLERLEDTEGYRRIKDWHERSPLNYRVILWPNSRKLTSPVKQREVFMEALDEIFYAGGWCVVFDEVLEFAVDLKMPRLVNRFLGQGRSNYITCVSGSQRPFDVPQRCFSQARHLFLWQTNDERDLKRFAEISGRVDKRAIMRVVQELPEFDVLYVNTRSGRMVITNTEGG